MPSSPVEYSDLADAIATAQPPTYVRKPWGDERIIELDNVLLKIITVDTGQRTSLQYHERKREVLTVLEVYGPHGGVHVTDPEDPNVVHVYGKGETVIIEPGMVHRSVACYLLEITTKDNDDVIRVEDDYGREAP